MNHKIIMSILILFTFNNSFAGDHVNNGGGLAEQRMTYAYLNMTRYIDLCLSASDCLINKKQRAVLELIKKQVPDELKNKKQLKFISEKKVPGTFIINSELKIAKTGDEIGSPILINLDLIYSKDGTPLSLARAIAILIHEFGHHNNSIIDASTDHTFLDLLGNKVALIYSDYKLVTPLSAARREVQISVFNPTHEKSFPNVILRVNNTMLDISKIVKEKLKCSRVILPLGVTIKSGKPKSTKLHNLHWTKIKEKSHSWNFKIVGNLSNFCNDHKSLTHFMKNFKLEIKFKAKKKITNGKVELTLKKDSIEISQIYDPWIKFFYTPII